MVEPYLSVGLDPVARVEGDEANVKIMKNTGRIPYMDLLI